ncbi:DDE family transposase [Donghicola tyrosinivorans]|uniref:DDE family transposase n=2 Tax=Donghicola tyrosinivorans TaxID=1652492 RepID=A0A2T0WNC8_9RHOB|nr:DDE family transposase [Donghicola tyrosinivorans]
MSWYAPPTGKRGYQPEFSDAGIQSCLTIKGLFGIPLRQTTGFVESLLRLARLDWKIPDFSTLCRRQKTLNVAIPYRGGSGPLHLLIDATGIMAEGKGEWNAHKHGGPKKRLWRKLHLGMDEETLQIRAVGVTTSNVGDAPMLPDLLEQIPADQDIATAPADGAHDTPRCHNVIAARGAAAIIPPRKNARLWKPTTASAVARNKAVRACKDLGRVLRRKWTGYHRRSRAETKMNCAKLLCQGPMARDFDRLVAELQVRITVLNRYTDLGIPVTEPIG